MSLYKPLKGQSLFKDANGQLAVGQFPNLPIIGWLVCALSAHLFHAGTVKTGLEALSKASLFNWAFLEIVQGDSYFRRLLGLVVLGFTITSFFV